MIARFAGWDAIAGSVLAALTFRPDMINGQAFVVNWRGVTVGTFVLPCFFDAFAPKFFGFFSCHCLKIEKVLESLLPKGYVPFNHWAVLRTIAKSSAAIGLLMSSLAVV